MGAPCSKHNNRREPDGGGGRREDDSESDAEKRSAAESPRAQPAPRNANNTAPQQLTEVPRRDRDADSRRGTDTVNPMTVMVSTIALEQDERHLERQQRERDERRRTLRAGSSDGEARDAVSYQAMLDQALERARLHQMLRQQREGQATNVLAVPPTTGVTRAAQEGGRVGAPNDDGPLGVCTANGMPTGDHLSSTDAMDTGGNPTSTATTATTSSAGAAGEVVNPSRNEMIPVAGLPSASPGTSLSTSETRSSASDVSLNEPHRAPPRRPLTWSDGDERQNRSWRDSGYAAGAGSSSTPSDSHPRRADRPIGPDAFSVTGDTTPLSRDRPSGWREKSVTSTSSYTTPSS